MTESASRNRMITQAAKSVLQPIGLFQKGQSRTWIDDNGWFLILVEFQPGGFGNGSYLNVGVHFLWNSKDHLAFEIGGRKEQFVVHSESESSFLEGMVFLSEKAASYIEQYRKLRSVDFSKAYLLEAQAVTSATWDLYHKMMLCGFTKDTRSFHFYRSLLSQIAESPLPFEQELYRELTLDMKDLIHDGDLLQNYIYGKIRRNRSFWSSKSGMRKLDARPFP